MRGTRSAVNGDLFPERAVYAAARYTDRHGGRWPKHALKKLETLVRIFENRTAPPRPYGDGARAILLRLLDRYVGGRPKTPHPKNLEPTFVSHLAALLALAPDLERPEADRVWSVVTQQNYPRAGSVIGHLLDRGDLGDLSAAIASDAWPIVATWAWPELASRPPFARLEVVQATLLADPRSMDAFIRAAEIGVIADFCEHLPPNSVRALLLHAVHASPHTALAILDREAGCSVVLAGHRMALLAELVEHPKRDVRTEAIARLRSLAAPA